MNLNGAIVLSSELRGFVIGRVEVESDPGSDVPVDCCQVICDESGQHDSAQLRIEKICNWESRG